MTINFTCPQCQATTQVDDSYAGQSGPCAQCGATVTVPSGARPAPAGSSGTKTIMIVLAVCVLGLLVCGGGLAALLIPAITTAQEAANISSCRNNLKQIGIALHNYHDTHKSMPPAYIPDDQGQPMTSWRVMILPFLEQQYLYDQYNFNEPWDSATNRALTSVPMQIYQCPADGVSSCNYFAVEVPDGIFDGAKATKFSGIIDGTSNTIMVVEVVGSNVQWAEPRDLGPAALTAGVNNTANGTGISSMHANGAVVLFADGSVRVLDPSTTTATLQLLITKSDGQPLPQF